MAKVIIYLSIVVRDGRKHLHLRDTNKKCADESLISEVSRGDLVIWKRDKRSGIKTVNDIEFIEDKEPFTKGLYKGWCQKWKGFISKDAEKGEYPYHIAYLACETKESNEKMSAGKNGDDPPPPVIKVRD